MNMINAPIIAKTLIELTKSPIIIAIIAKKKIHPIGFTFCHDFLILNNSRIPQSPFILSKSFFPCYRIYFFLYENTHHNQYNNYYNRNYPEHISLLRGSLRNFIYLFLYFLSGCLWYFRGYNNRNQFIYLQNSYICLTTSNPIQCNLNIIITIICQFKLFTFSNCKHCLLWCRTYIYCCKSICQTNYSNRMLPATNCKLNSCFCSKFLTESCAKLIFCDASR